MPFTIVLLLLGFVLIIKGADFLVDGAASIAARLRISDLVIGLTVVSFGTSTPELFVSIISSFQGNTDIAIGNILGSNIANILLILGVSSIVYPLSVPRGTIWKEIPFSLLVAIVLAFVANDRLLDNASESAISRSDGLVLLCFFCIFLYYSFSVAMEEDNFESQAPEGTRSLLASVLLVFVGLGGLSLGGQLVVDSAAKLAKAFGMSDKTVGLTIVALGTSLPELATSAMAAWKKNVEIAVGNVIGSNIFNILLVLGLSSVIIELPFHRSSNRDIGVLLIASLLLFIFMFTLKRRSLDRWEGVVFVVFYFVYMAITVIAAD
jgi:cation:H+ antiporter